MPDFSGAVWRKSSRSNGAGGECVEIAVVPAAVGIRDSKNSTGPALVVTPAAFAAFIDTVKAGQLDR
jgi:hypothetical protein